MIVNVCLLFGYLGNVWGREGRENLSLDLKLLELWFVKLEFVYKFLSFYK